MKANGIRLAVVIVLVALAAFWLVTWYGQPSEHDAAVTRCMEGGDGDMFTSRQLCEERYAPNAARSLPSQNSN